MYIFSGFYSFELFFQTRNKKVFCVVFAHFALVRGVAFFAGLEKQREKSFSRPLTPTEPRTQRPRAAFIFGPTNRKRLDVIIIIIGSD